MTDRILLVDDERDIVDLLEAVLRKEGFSLIAKSFTGQDAINTAREYEPDIIVLDIMLPDIDGIEVCKKIREFSHCSILFLSSKNDVLDKILGLSSGGDDYMTKPFSPKELVYRAKSQLRRQQFAKEDADPQSKAILQCGNISLDTVALNVTKDDQTLELTAKEYKLLKYLMENPNRIISKERLYEQAWGEESAICDNTIMVHIRHLREKLEEDASSPQLIITVKGLGYKLVSRTKA